MAVSFLSLPAASSIFAMYASLSALVMLVQTMLNQLLPRQLQHYFLDLVCRYFSPRATHATVLIEERDGMFWNEIYTAVETYLCSHVRPDIQSLKISKDPKNPSLSIRFAKCEKIIDHHGGATLEWRFVNEDRKKSDDDPGYVYAESEKKYFELSYDKKFRDVVLESYIPSILERVQMMRAEKKVVKLHTLACGSSFVWDSISLEHPSTFNTLAMDPALKKSIMDDLDRFVRRKDFYRRVGKAWKRGYLLYGPPGTGKSSLIAAMANYLKFDIYDLELTNIKRDSDLRRLLLKTANRSILIIEDIDCTVDLPDRNGGASDVRAARGQPRRPNDHQFTLAGLLNFIDGLWSSCGDERIIVFTTNNKDKLDPALLRPGRMDMHIHMSYLTPDGFAMLASTYLNVDAHHPRLSEIRDLIKIKNVTPAEVAEELMKSDDVDLSLDEMVNFLKNKAHKNNIIIKDDAKSTREKGIEVDVAKFKVDDCDFEMCNVR